MSKPKYVRFGDAPYAPTWVTQTTEGTYGRCRICGEDNADDATYEGWLFLLEWTAGHLALRHPRWRALRDGDPAWPWDSALRS